jgi:hypothetical protein
VTKKIASELAENAKYLGGEFSPGLVRGGLNNNYPITPNSCTAGKFSN